MYIVTTKKYGKSSFTEKFLCLSEGLIYHNPVYCIGNLRIFLMSYPVSLSKQTNKYIHTSFSEAVLETIGGSHLSNASLRGETGWFF